MIQKVERYAIVLFRFSLNRQIENRSTERFRFRLNVKQNWYAIVQFPCKQPICPFQKFERRWSGTIPFPCELGLKLDSSMYKMSYMWCWSSSSSLTSAIYKDLSSLQVRAAKKGWQGGKLPQGFNVQGASRCGVLIR